MEKPIKRRVKIAFFDYPDVFEDFYPHYSVDQKTFATTWHNTGSHAWLKIVQEEIGDVTWYVFSLKPEVETEKHQYVNCTIKFMSSSWFHRILWKFYYTSSGSWKWRDRFYNLFAILSSYSALLSFRFFRELNRNRPDVIFVQEYCSGRFDILVLYALLKKIPIITYHAGSTPERYVGKYLKKFTISSANYIFPSGNTELYRLKKTYGISDLRLGVIRPPVDTSVYKIKDRKEAFNKLNMDSSVRYFIFICRLDDDTKCISSIIRCFQKLCEEFNDLVLLIAGTGNDGIKLKGHAHASADKIKFLGWVESDDEKSNLLNISECLVMASKREGFPGVISEAFSCGIPVISSRVGTIPDLVVEDETGWLFEPKDENKLYERMKWVATYPEKVARMRKHIREIATKTVSFNAITEIMKEGFSMVNERGK